jgi:hypothetical protein
MTQGNENDAHAGTPPNLRGDNLLAQLIWVHDHIRRDLDAIKRVTEEIAGGAPAGDVRARIDELAAYNRVWTLRVNCVRYCKFVHMHHTFEDTGWFPTLRQMNPDLNPVIDKLEADHAEVSRYLDEVEDAARHLGDDEESRAALAGSLAHLAEHLLAHLEYEETNLAPTLLSTDAWPPGY